ncbi:MAG: xylulokinase [Acidimicrobiaceae bacterium]|nr:xylulokinase [Acidimicrobiaceae bacterium]
MILTVDLGTTVTKVALWDAGGLVALGRAPLVTARPELGWAEQDPESWWASVVEATRAAGTAAGRSLDSVRAVSCCGARQTFVPVDGDGAPLGPGLLWSDRRAGAEARALAEALGGAGAVRARTGVPLDGGSVAAKLSWLGRHHPERMAGARWLLSPRDLVVARLTGRVTTDVTMASRTGLYDLDGLHDVDGDPVDELVGPAAGLVPPIVAPGTVVGSLVDAAVEALGLPAGVPVVTAAGDRACEALGGGASPSRPLVSWGTTASVVMPVDDRPDVIPHQLVLTRSASAGWLVEGGLSAAGSLISWLADLTGTDVADLMAAAAGSPPGARGVVAVPWLDGARAPWWRGDARAGFVGLGSAHDAADLGRAAVEAVAADVRRCLAVTSEVARDSALADDRDGAGDGAGLVLAGLGSTDPLWSEVLAGVTGEPVTTRRSAEAASVGAALLGASAVGWPVSLEDLNPIVADMVPRPEAVDLYRRWSSRADRVAEALVELDLGEGADETGPA